MYMYMSTHNITITKEAYERLKVKKEPRESFSDVIVRITKKGNIMDFAGILTEKEAYELERNIRESRRRSGLRAEKVRKRLNE